MSTTAIVWFRRDLRLNNNPALKWAINHADRILPVYIYAPDEEAPWQAGSASRWWLEQSLIALDRELKKHGLALHCFPGNSIAVLKELFAQTGATSLLFNKLYEPHLHQRDANITESLKNTAVDIKTFDSGLFFRPGSILNQQNLPYRVYTPFSKKIRSELAIKGIAATARNSKVQASQVRLATGSTSVQDLKLMQGFDWYSKFHQYWQPGEQPALKRADEFIETILCDYENQRDIPARDGTSALSAHLHFGEITVEQIYSLLLPALDSQYGEATRQSAERFLNQLIWREFAHHILWHFPHTATEPMDRRYSAAFWHKPGKNFEQWTRGETGIPIIDAGMKQLWETGWMHNRVRMIAASFLTKNLGCHWLDGARWFWDTLVDANLANNSLGWQWVAGCGVDAAPYYRIFNPLTQTKRFDTDHVYINRWAPCALQPGYQPPIINLSASREQALRQYKDFISYQQD